MQEEISAVPHLGDPSLYLDRDGICAQILSMDGVDPEEPLGRGQCGAGAVAKVVLEPWLMWRCFPFIARPM